MIGTRYFYWRSNKVQSIHFKQCYGDTDPPYVKKMCNSTFLLSLQTKLSPTDLLFIIKYGDTLRPVIHWIYSYIIIQWHFQRQPMFVESVYIATHLQVYKTNFIL